MTCGFRQLREKRCLALASAFLLCCSTVAQTVRTSRAPGVTFSKYHTYRWVVIKGVHADPSVDAQIKQSIDSQLAAKGLTKVDSGKADLLVGYQVALTQEKQWNASGSVWGGGPGWGGWGPLGMESLSGTATSSTINIGTLVLGIYDGTAKQLVWMGAASKTINPGKNQEKNRKNLDKATQKLLKDFPPNANRH